jgi:hypothetical protein
MRRIDFQAIRERHDLRRFFESIWVKLRHVAGNFTGRCPFHDEQHGSALVVYPKRQRWFCYGKCQRGGDIIDAVSLLNGIRISVAALKLCSLNGLELSNPYREKVPLTRLAHSAVALPNLTVPSERDLFQLGRLRSIAQEALQIAVAREFLWTYNDYREGRIWCLTDKSRRLVIARRLDGKLWEYRGCEWIADPAERPKSKNLYGSQGKWPLGIQESELFPAIALVEGAPNFLSVIAHAWSSNVEKLVAPVCLSGAAQSIPDDALPYFSGKRVRIFVDNDLAGYKGARRWWDQLEKVTSRIDIFTFDGLKQTGGHPVNDLNDLLRIDYDDWEAHRTIVGTLMDFALREGG